MQGAKLVLFVTGVCDLYCGYCPLSEKRWQNDVVYANERLITSDEEILEEADLMDALGTGITGGDPLLRLDRTLHYARLLKSVFNDHHIHLYTGSSLNDEVLHLMEGLIDEIRIHLFDFSNIDSVEKALNHGFCTGVEIPMIPSRLEETRTLINRLKREGIHFVNLNELEYADRNITYLKNLGYSLDENSCRVKGSEEAALELADDEVVHYCSASDKDSLQLRNRLMRRARNVRKPFEEIEDGLLVKGVISCRTEGEAKHIKELLLSKVDIPESYIAVTGNRVETHWALAEEASSWIKAEIGIEKRYPTFDQPLIEYIPVT
ncbi:MAG: radical SAM protein [Theionarchaea archaeon]|nr:radical SAM protein [Theionarchaea archaeon]